MPWFVKKIGGKKPWGIFKGHKGDKNAKLVGRSKTKEEALASIRARYANSPEAINKVVNKKRKS